MGARMGDPSGCGTGRGGSHPSGPTLLSALGYLRFIPSAAPSGEEHGFSLLWLLPVRVKANRAEWPCVRCYGSVMVWRWPAGSYSPACGSEPSRHPLLTCCRVVVLIHMLESVGLAGALCPEIGVAG